MGLPENDYQIIKLSEKFYEQYKNPPYREILKKNSFSYLFHHSARAKKHKSGLDYTKILIISKTEYLDVRGAIIDRDEYIETMRNFEKIKRAALKYVEDYIAHICKKNILNPKAFERKYGFSTLQYFHEELGLTNR